MDKKKSRLEEFLERIQSADDATKKRWLVVSTGVISVFVIVIWIVSFNVMISGNSVQETADDASASPSFLATVGYGFGTITSGLSAGIHALGNALKTPRSIIVKPP